MELNLLKQWILENCFSKNGSLNNRISIDSWWINRNFLSQKNSIVQVTDWLDTDNITQRIYHIINEINNIGTCKYCGNPTSFKQYKSGYGEYCSLLCATKSPERNDKISKNRDMPSIIEKCKITNMKKYGVKSYCELEEFKEKSKQTKLEKYGNENYNNCENNSNSLKFKDSDYQKFLMNKKIEKYGSIFVHDFGGESKAELEILDFLNTTGFLFKKNVDLLPNFEIDAYCDELKLGIEYCGLYWHSEKFKSKWYHYKKMDDYRKLGINIITIFEDEWLWKNNQVKQFLKAKLGIFNQRVYARKCQIIEIEKNYDFFRENHIFGVPNRIDRLFGLFHDDHLIGAVSYGLHHRNVEMLTINRLAFKSGIQCIGGASKLLKNSLQLLNNDVITWSDNRWTTGDLYHKSGFNFDGNLIPDYSYVLKNRTRTSKQSMKKDNIGCPSDVTEHEFCLSKGILRIYDCGKKRWIYKKGTI